MFFGVFGMDSSVAKLFNLFDDYVNPSITEQEKIDIHEQLKDVVRYYSSTMFTDFEGFFGRVDNYIQNSNIDLSLKMKFSGTINNLIVEYREGNLKLKDVVTEKDIEQMSNPQYLMGHFKSEEIKNNVIFNLEKEKNNKQISLTELSKTNSDLTIKDFMEKYKAENGNTYKSFKTKKQIKDIVDIYALNFLSSTEQSASLTPEEKKIFLNLYSDFNKATQISQIPKMVNRMPGFDIKQDSHIDEIINMYFRAYKKLQKADACTIEWDASYEQGYQSDSSINLKEAKLSYDYLKKHGKVVRLLSQVYPNAHPEFIEYSQFQNKSMTKEEKLQVARTVMDNFETYLHELFKTCPEVDYIDFFNELAYDEGMHQGQKRSSFEIKTLKGKSAQITLETGSNPRCIDDNGEKVSVFEYLFGKRYYIPFLLVAKKVITQERKLGRAQNVKLMYNEFGHENAEKSKNILAIISDIVKYEQENNIQLLDGIGVQCRLNSNIPNESEKNNRLFSSEASLENIETFIEVVNKLDRKVPLEVQITEMDCVKATRNLATNEIIDEKTAQENQERVYQRISDIATEQMKKGNIQGFTLGDFNNATSFQNVVAHSHMLSENSAPNATTADYSGKEFDWAKLLIDELRTNIQLCNEKQNIDSHTNL